MATLAEIEKMAQSLSEARENLKDLMSELEEKTLEIRNQYLPAIRKAANKMKEKKDNLSGAVDQNRDLFIRPRTLTLFGIRFGIQKGKGKLEWDKGAVPGIIKLIKKFYEDSWKIYIKVKETPIKKTLSNLSSTELKRLGIQIKDTGDFVFIEPVDSEVDKWVDALLNEKKELEEEEDEAA